MKVRPVLIIAVPALVGVVGAVRDAAAQEFRDLTAILRELAPLAAPQAVVGAGAVVPTAPAARPSLDLNIQFALNSAELTPDAVRQVEALGAALNSEQLLGQRILIAGHTDATGTAEQNLALSFRRANAVRDYLIAKHEISPGRIATVGFGEERLKDKVNPAAAINRRVEITVLGPLVAERRQK